MNIRKERCLNSSGIKRGYRSLRIERAAADILECEILPSFDDPMLFGLHVFSVNAAGGLACLHVLVAPATAADLKDPETVEAALSKVEGRVRSELAASLRIKRMPVVRLRYVPLAMNEQVGTEEGGAE